MNRSQRKFVCDALDEPWKLTDWEADFVNSLADKEDDYELSEKQNTILNRIQRKVYSEQNR